MIRPTTDRQSHSPSALWRARFEQSANCDFYSGGVIQEIFASDRDTGIVLVHWDTDETTLQDPDVVRVGVAGRERHVRVVDFPPQPLAELAGTDAELAVEAAFEEGVLHEPSC